MNTKMHVSLYVKDLNKSISFYSKFFQTPPAKVKAHYAKYELENPQLVISMVENPDRVQPGFGHLGFRVDTEAELQERLALAKRDKLVTEEEIGTACCYAVQDKFWAEDPDGVRWEVYYFHADSEFNDPRYAMEDTSACCMPAAEKETATLVTVEEKEACCTPGSGCC